MSDMKEKPKQILVTVSMSQADKDLLELLAHWVGTNRSDMVRKAVTHYYEDYLLKRVPNDG